MSLLHLVADRAEIARRRALLPAGTLLEAWPDLALGDHFWVGDEAKALLDAAGPPIRPRLSVSGSAVPVYYGPRLADLESLPTEESLRARVLSGRGVAVAWITIDRSGQRTTHAPGPAPRDDDPVFFLRRPRGSAAHLWRLFRGRDDAVAYVSEAFSDDAQAQAWARALPFATFEELLARHATPG
jgi:hypothetical protein